MCECECVCVCVCVCVCTCMIDEGTYHLEARGKARLILVKSVAVMAVSVVVAPSCFSSSIWGVLRGWVR